MSIDVLWVFHKSEETLLKVVPRRSKQLKGVFATRSPKRPNHIGLTTVMITDVRDTKIYIKGCDMIDGTPVIDIKPNISTFIK